MKVNLTKSVLSSMVYIKTEGLNLTCRCPDRPSAPPMVALSLVYP